MKSRVLGCVLEQDTIPPDSAGQHCHDIRLQIRQEILGEVLSLPKKILDKFGLDFTICLHILYIYIYIFTSPSDENKKFVHLGRLFLPFCPVGYVYSKTNILKKK